MNIVCDNLKPVMKMLKAINLVLIFFGIILTLSFRAKADTLLMFSIFDKQWKMKRVSADAFRKIENIRGEVGFSNWDHTKADCDSPTLQMLNLTSIANIANQIEGGPVGSLPKEEVSASEIADRDKIIGDVVQVANGQGTIVSENNCYAVVATVFHNLAEHTTRNGKRVPMTKSMPLADINHRHFEPIKRFSSERRIGKVERIISVPSNNTVLDDSEEASLLIIKKPKCDSLSGAQKFAGARHHKVFDFNKALNYSRDMGEDRSGEAGIYSLCKFEGKLQRQRGGISRIQISDSVTNKGKQDLALLNTKSQEGDSGCPVVYRDKNGVDHFAGMTASGIGKGPLRRVTSHRGEVLEADQIAVTLFSKDIADALSKIRQDASYFR